MRIEFVIPVRPATKKNSGQIIQVNSFKAV